MEEMEQQIKSFNVLGQYIKDLSFENPKAPASLSIDDQGNINVSVNVDVQQLRDEVFEVAVSVNVKAASKEETVFVLEATYAGVFDIKIENKDELEMVLLVHCPNMLFPYVRRIISDTTRDGGFTPLMLNPVDFTALYLRKKEEEKNNSTKKAAQDN
jgi:preprotein translocase subunit SecB